MAKKALVTDGGVYHKVKKGFVTHEAVYRKIKKAFMTVGGVYRPCWSGGELAYYGPAETLSQDRMNASAATVGKYALIAGGYRVSDYYKNVDAYDTSLTRTTATSLRSSGYGIGAASVGDYALFGKAGYMDAYNSSLTRSNATALSTSRSELTAASIGNYALFAGGMGSSSMTSYSTVDAYNASLTRSVATALTGNRMRLAATTVGSYALFAGGCQSYTSSDAVRRAYVDAYNASLTKTTATDLTTARHDMGTTTVGNYALFAGGDQSDSWRTQEATVVEVYNASLTKSTATDLSTKRMWALAHGATTVGDYALFPGGSYSTGSSTGASTDVVDAYDASLTRTTPRAISSKGSPTSITLGDYALVVCCPYSNTTVDVYTAT